MVPDINLQKDNLDLNLDEEFDNLSPVASPLETTPPQSPARRTIQDVWSDINVSVLDHQPNPATKPNPNPFSMSDANLLDFIQPVAVASTVTAATEGSPRRRSRRSRPRSTTTLTLSPTGSNRHVGLSFGNKVAADEAAVERRHQRLIKNRDSAARSRARKQAYTNELEKEVDRLHKDNERLRRRQRQLEALEAAREQNLPKMKYGGLYRTLTGPF